MQSSKKGTRQPVNTSALLQWKEKLKHGDKTAIALRYGYLRGEVMTAFEGLASPTLVKAINEFYELRNTMG